MHGRFPIVAGGDAHARDVVFRVVTAKPGGQRCQYELDRLAVNAFDARRKSVVKSFAHGDNERFFDRLLQRISTNCMITEINSRTCMRAFHDVINDDLMHMLVYVTSYTPLCQRIPAR